MNINYKGFESKRKSHWTKQNDSASMEQQPFIMPSILALATHKTAQLMLYDVFT